MPLLPRDLWLALAVIVSLCGHAAAQDATLIHPDAESISERDRVREGRKENRFWSDWSADYKAKRLFFFRTERDRSVAGAIARTDATQPFVKRTPPRMSAETEDNETAVGTGSRAPIEIPSFVTAPANRIVDTARKTAGTIDRVAESITREFLPSPPPKNARSGLFAVLLIAMFLVPSAGLAALIVAVAHLRAHSLRTGTIFLASGVVILWASVSAALSLRADALTVPTMELDEDATSTLPIARD